MYLVTRVTRKVEVLNSLIMKITAKAIDVNDVVDILVTAATTISAFT